MSLSIRKIRIKNEGINFFSCKKGFFLFMILYHDFFFINTFTILAVTKEVIKLWFKYDRVWFLFTRKTKSLFGLISKLANFQINSQIGLEVQGFASTSCRYFHKLWVHKPKIVFNVQICFFLIKQFYWIIRAIPQWWFDMILSIDKTIDIKLD